MNKVTFKLFVIFLVLLANGSLLHGMESKKTVTVTLDLPDHPTFRNVSRSIDGEKIVYEAEMRTVPRILHIASSDLMTRTWVARRGSVLAPNGRMAHSSYTYLQNLFNQYHLIQKAQPSD